MIGLSAGERARLEHKLGEPLLAPDPLIDVKQASAILGLSTTTVRSLLRSGALPREEAAQGQLSSRMIRLAVVLAWAEGPPRITVAAAAGILGESRTAVHRLTAVRLLTWYGGPLPLSRREVEDLAERRLGWLTLAQAAGALEVSPEKVHVLLASGELKHTRDVSRPVDKAQVPSTARMAVPAR
ncbi:helix-turn-helix protein [Kribbella voronezhensis]|uniref:Helix-turn-helix protein n=1 Tax=Kribbella voronezhensis TaxID=2512212 RepID=A0A4R7SX01_9ACTN|nr:helix-turn-helix domain-containing protein [Kribbella voronezhensis]TDU83761.1 helix-turn-helix protein [Kribbella voronezhensis]